MPRKYDNRRNYNVYNAVLPTALEVADETDYPDSFITERAVNDLNYLTSLGPKLTGSSENEYVVVEYLSNTISSIISESHPNQYIEFDLQNVTGGYYLDDIAGFMNVYDRAQNVIVKLHGAQNESQNSLLVNSHFDTVPASPGGSDDGINVVIMLEILRKLSLSEERQSHNIIFLFNGAEEAPLKTAHVLINLESSGAGGKLILFQTGPQTPWLLKYYRKVPHPYGSVSAEEVFQAGIIPSDTDFRIFRDFGNLVGVDMAYYKDGYRYHTKYDGFDNIPLGSYQHGGDNTLALVKYLANAPEVAEQNGSIGNSVYFDVFGLFMIAYRLKKSTIKFYLFTVLAIIFGWILSALYVVGLAYLLDPLSKTMSWYGAPWFIFGLYIVPTFGLSGFLTSFVNNRNLSLGVRSQLQAHLLRLVWTFLLIVGTILNIRSTYIIMIPVLFSSIGFLVINVFRLHRTVRVWLIIYTGSLLIPIAYIIYQGWLSLHTHRQFFDKTANLTRNNSGILLLNMDRNSPNAVKAYVPQLKEPLSIEDDCNQYTFCAMPLTLGKAIKRIKYSSWIVASQPSFPANETLKFEVVSKDYVTSTRLKYFLRITGPDRLEFYFTPKTNATLLSVSLIDAVEPTKFTFKDRSVYVVLYQLGKGDGTPLEFNLVMEIPENHQGPTVDLGISARYVHQARIEKNAEYLELGTPHILLSGLSIPYYIKEKTGTEFLQEPKILVQKISLYFSAFICQPRYKGREKKVPVKVWPRRMCSSWRLHIFYFAEDIICYIVKAKCLA
ncbi:hypothetical protein D910_02451 [Dendroctonus ponderosae]|uniref:FXNA-like protease n=1 Tax=Dendroctonus ponderosae TaxID=77166 RepID=U4TYD3_DENPD|nr:hypothetical protein D910_02451 [Dendroctonus ponderosae]